MFQTSRRHRFDVSVMADNFFYGANSKKFTALAALARLSTLSSCAWAKRSRNDIVGVPYTAYSILGYYL